MTFQAYRRKTLPRFPFRLHRNRPQRAHADLIGEFGIAPRLADGLVNRGDYTRERSKDQLRTCFSKACAAPAAKARTHTSPARFRIEPRPM